MLSNRLAFAALAIACIGAAAGGGYLATRQNVVPAPASAEMMAPAAAPAPALTAEAPPPTPAVQETEAVVGDRPQNAPTPEATPLPKATASRNAEPERTAPRASNRRPAPSRTPSDNVARQEQPPPLTSSWPSSAGSQPPAAPQPPMPAETQIAHPEERTVQEPPRPIEPLQKTFEELVVTADSVSGTTLFPYTSDVLAWTSRW